MIPRTGRHHDKDRRPDRPHAQTKVAAIKRQLQVGNAWLIAIEREQRELRDNMKTLAELLKRARKREQAQ